MERESGEEREREREREREFNLMEGLEKKIF